MTVYINKIQRLLATENIGDARSKKREAKGTRGAHDRRRRASARTWRSGDGLAPDRR